MRIAFNGQRLAGQPFGVGRYLEYLLRYWKEQLVEGEEVSLFVRQPLAERLSELGPRIRTVLLESRLPGIAVGDPAPRSGRCRSQTCCFARLILLRLGTAAGLSLRTTASTRPSPMHTAGCIGRPTRVFTAIAPAGRMR